MTPQDFATQQLLKWQEQRVQRIPPEQRKLDEDYERDIEALRRTMGRKA